MKWFFLTSLVLMIAATPVLAQVQEKFAACASKTGKPYQEARDQFLAAAATAEFLETKLESKAWRDRLAARILLGWSKHQADYRLLLDARKETDQTGASSYVWSLGRSTIQGKDVPLMYELLMKDIDASASWDAARALLSFVERQKVPLDMTLLHHYLRDPESSSAGRGAVAWLVGGLPAKYHLAAKELQTTLQAELGRADKHRGIVLAMLSGMGNAAQEKSTLERDRLTQMLLTLDNLEAMVGKAALIHALGNIGGDKASEQLAAYLENTKDSVEKLWALGALAGSDSKIGTKVVLAYADSAQPALRNKAIEGLGKAHFVPEVATKLEAIALNKKATPGQQILAVRSLAMISMTHPRDADLQKQIQTRIQTISAGSSSSQLRQELKQIYQSIYRDAPP